MLEGVVPFVLEGSPRPSPNVERLAHCGSGVASEGTQHTLRDFLKRCAAGFRTATDGAAIYVGREGKDVPRR